MAKNKAAVSLGRKGGSVKSAAKTAACRLNGVKGAAARWANHTKKADAQDQQPSLEASQEDLTLQ